MLAVIGDMIVWQQVLHVVSGRENWYYHSENFLGRFTKVKLGENHNSNRYMHANIRYNMNDNSQWHGSNLNVQHMNG